MKFLCNFFEESPGISSSSRLVFILGTFFNMALTAYLAHTGKYDLISLATFCASIEAVFAGQKIWNKTIEEKNNIQQ